jgi:hypothetical protein
MPRPIDDPWDIVFELEQSEKRKARILVKTIIYGSYNGKSKKKEAY